MFRSLSFLFAVLLALAAVAPPASAADAVEASAATSVGASTSIGAAVKPFLRKHCFDCHGDSDGEAGINLASFPDRIETAEQAAGWLRVLEQVQADLMPPLDQQRPGAEERSRALFDLEASLLASGHADAYRQKLLLPEYGNYVDHRLLFSGRIAAPAFSPSRLWRLSPEIYLSQFGNKADRHKSPFVYSTAESGFRDYAATSTADQSTVEMIMVTVAKMLEDELLKVRGGEKKSVSFRRGKENVVVVKPDPTHRYAPFVADAPPTSAQKERLISDEFSRVHRRPPHEDERRRYREFLDANIAAGGNLEAMKATVLAIHLSPEAIFRLEIGLGPSDEHGRRRLSEQELAYALSYALTDQSPYQHGVVSAALRDGKLATAEGVRETVAGMLSDTQDERRGRTVSYAQANPRILRFFQEFFDYTRATSVFKDDQRKKEELDMRAPNSQMELRIVRDLDALILHVVAEDNDVLRQLLTTDRYFVGHSGDNSAMRQMHENFLAGNKEKGRFKNSIEAALAKGLTPFPGNPHLYSHVKLYGLPHGPGREGPQLWSYPLEQPVALPHRKGVLTHPAWLWAHSTNFDNDPIHRGIWIRRKLLAGVIPDVPPDVDARVPEDPHKTLRERLDVVRSASCWKCHQKFNPLGETLEVFDDWGRHREVQYFTESGELFARRDGVFRRQRSQGKLTVKPIDATGELRGTGSDKLDGPVTDAFDLIDRLAGSQRVRQSFVRHAFRYFMGRNEMLSDSQTLIAADKAYVDSGGSFKALVAALLTSDSFLYRK